MVRNYKSPAQASLCQNQNCITVYGTTAEIINALAITVAVITAVSLVVKALR